MKNRQTIPSKALAVGLAALSCSAAFAQMTNTLPATYAYPTNAANTSQPGFIFNVSQVSAAEPNTLAWAESQLNGERGPNLADPTQIYSSASGVATVPGDPDLPITFIVPGVINFSRHRRSRLQ